MLPTEKRLEVGHWLWAYAMDSTQAQLGSVCPTVEAHSAALSSLAQGRSPDVAHTFPCRPGETPPLARELPLTRWEEACACLLLFFTVGAALWLPVIAIALACAVPRIGYAPYALSVCACVCVRASFDQYTVITCGVCVSLCGAVCACAVGARYHLAASAVCVCQWGCVFPQAHPALFRVCCVCCIHVV